MEQFTTFQISKALGIKYGRLREWLDRGYIVPSIQKADRRGVRSLFSREDIYLIKLLSHLVDMGFSREAAAQMYPANPNPALREEILSCLYVVCYRGKNDVLTVFWPKPEITINLLGKTMTGEKASFDDVYIVNVKKIKEDVDRSLP
jgi:DNA-binding transcriptional MerR regulator